MRLFSRGYFLQGSFFDGTIPFKDLQFTAYFLHSSTTEVQHHE